LLSGAGACVLPSGCARASVAGPPQPGVYGWWFRRLPPLVASSRCCQHQGLTLLYAGISPDRPPQNGRAASKQSLRERIRYHYTGNAEGSTLRKTLGCLLAAELGIQLRRVGSGTRLTFADGEQALSKSMAENAYVSWIVHGSPWELEDHLIAALDLPLNLQGNKHNQVPSCTDRYTGELRSAGQGPPCATQSREGRPVKISHAPPPSANRAGTMIRNMPGTVVAACAGQTSKWQLTVRFRAMPETASGAVCVGSNPTGGAS
jgi:hypothetical protein